MSDFDNLNRSICECDRCPRLRKYCQDIANKKRRAFMDWDYWGRPVPNFGDPDAEILIVGLAPAAHGANRTGRMFTGDESGSWLYQALWETGLASQPDAIHREDGLMLHKTLITAAAHCAPPENKPTREEFDNCRHWLLKTMDCAKQWKVAVVLGRMAFDETLRALELKQIGPKIPRNRFKHGTFFQLDGGRWLVCSYHPSQRNTYTGMVTREMLRSVFELAGELANRD